MCATFDRAMSNQEQLVVVQTPAVDLGSGEWGQGILEEAHDDQAFPSVHDKEKKMLNEQTSNSFKKLELDVLYNRLVYLLSLNS